MPPQSQLLHGYFNMVVRENLDLYRYEIHSLVKAFYPEQNVKVIVDGDPHGDQVLRNDPYIFLEVKLDRASITLCFRGKEGEKVCSFSPPVTAADIRFTEKSHFTRDSLKVFLYDSLSEYTGRMLPWGDLIGIRPTKLAMTQLDKGCNVPETAEYLEKEHRVSPEKALLAAEIAERERSILSRIHYENGYSLYIGIPFCPTTCMYCSFPSFNIALWKDRIDDYLAALERELKAAAEIMKGRPLDTVYIGGGTPTSLEAEQLDRLCQAVERNFDMSTVQEFTVEAGRADSITGAKLKTLKSHRVTRISVNPQTMKEETLRIIGRHHTVQQVIDAFHAARDCGFDNINMDIILGLPGEDAGDVRHTVEEIEQLGPDSLTVHSLAIKRASRLRRIIDENGYPVFINTDETMQIAADAAQRMGMKPYYLYRQKNMSGNFENVGYAGEGRYGIYNILIMEEKQSIMALGAGAVTKRVIYKTPHVPLREESCTDAKNSVRIERCDNAKDIATYLTNLDEMIDRKRRLFEEDGV